jgi:hypothetical protein
MNNPKSLHIYAVALNQPSVRNGIAPVLLMEDGRVAGFSVYERALEVAQLSGGIVVGLGSVLRTWDFPKRLAMRLHVWTWHGDARVFHTPLRIGRQHERVIRQMLNRAYFGVRPEMRRSVERTLNLREAVT